MADDGWSQLRRTARRWGRGLHGGLSIEVRDDAVESPPSSASTVGGVDSDSETDSPSPTTTTFPPPPPPPETTTTKIQPSGALGAAQPSLTESTSTTESKSLPAAITIATSSSELSTSTSSTSTSSSTTSSSTSVPPPPPASTSVAPAPTAAAPATTSVPPATMSTVFVPSTLTPSTAPSITAVLGTASEATPILATTGAPQPSGVDSSLTPQPQESGPPPPPKSLMGMQAGIALGSIAGIAVVVSLGFCMYKWRKRRRPESDGGSSRFDPGPGGVSGSRPWTRVTEGSWMGFRKREDRSESGVIDDMIRAAYNAENGGMNNAPGYNGYLDEKNAAANGYFAPPPNNPGDLPPTASTPRIAELATFDLRTPLPTQQAPHYSFLDRPPTVDRPPSAYWFDRRSVATSITTSSAGMPPAAAGEELVSPETPRSTSSRGLSWLRRDPARRLEQERRRVRNVEAAHMKLVGQHAGTGLNKTLQSKVAMTRAEATASVAVTEATTTDGTWKTWGGGAEMPRVKNWLERCMEKGGLK